MKAIYLTVVLMITLFSSNIFAEHPKFKEFKKRFHNAGYPERAAAATANLAGLGLVCPAVGVETTLNAVAKLVPFVSMYQSRYAETFADDYSTVRSENFTSFALGGIIGGALDIITGVGDFADLKQDEEFWENLSQSFNAVKVVAEKRYAEDSVCMSSIRNLDIMIFESRPAGEAGSKAARDSDKQSSEGRRKSNNAESNDRATQQ